LLLVHRAASSTRPGQVPPDSLSAAFIGSLAWRQQASNLQNLGLRGDFGLAGQTGIRVLPNTGMWLELGMLVGPPCLELDLDVSTLCQGWFV